MPLITPSEYRAPFGFGNRHVQTMFPALFRKVELVTTERERIDTPDGDFLDIDWTPRRHKRLAILSHGLEGTSRQPYMQGMARALQKRGWDVLAWNYRGCSGEPNRLAASYHSGKTDDLQTVIDHASDYDSIALVGFSIGGNITLKYLGDAGANHDPRICAAFALSVPIDLAGSATTMAEPSQRFYMKRFMKCLRMKIRWKIESHPEKVKDLGLEEIKTFREFDEKYSAPMNGFKDANDYWTSCSSKPVLKNIRVPTLLLSSKDDPFLPPSCYPEEIAKASQHLHFEPTEKGGHVGFIKRGGEYYAETRAAQFLETAKP